jgi:hypothetical protein
VVDRDPADASARVNALARRFVGALVLFGGALLLLALGAVLMMPHADGLSGYVVPGTAGRHRISMTVVPVLIAAIGLLAFGGVAAVLAGSRSTLVSGRPWPRSGMRRGRALVILLGGGAALAAVLLRR